MSLNMNFFHSLILSLKLSICMIKVSHKFRIYHALIDHIL